MARPPQIEFNATVTVESLGRYTSLLTALSVNTASAIQIGRLTLLRPWSCIDHQLGLNTAISIGLGGDWWKSRQVVSLGLAQMDWVENSIRNAYDRLKEFRFTP